jgi:hypothetical protein
VYLRGIPWFGSNLYGKREKRNKKRKEEKSFEAFLLEGLEAGSKLKRSGDNKY